jgi:hypothetical protein
MLCELASIHTSNGRVGNRQAKIARIFGIMAMSIADPVERRFCRSRKETMKYLCLVYGEEQAIAAMSDNECLDWSDTLRKTGRQIAAEALQPVRTARTVRVRNGKTSVTDGPFAETKEFLAGFYLVEAETFDEAVEVAAQIPPARVGSIEVRPIRELRRGRSYSNQTL